MSTPLKMTKLIIGNIEISNGVPLTNQALELLRTLNECDTVLRSATVTPTTAAFCLFVAEQRKRAAIQSVEKPDEKLEKTIDTDALSSSNSAKAKT